MAIIAVLTVWEREERVEPMPTTAKKSDLLYLMLYYYIIKIANDELKFVSYDKKASVNNNDI